MYNEVSIQWKRFYFPTFTVTQFLMTKLVISEHQFEKKDLVNIEFFL